MSLGSRIAIGVAVVLALTLFVLGFVMARVTRVTLTAEILRPESRGISIFPPVWDFTADRELHTMEISNDTDEQSPRLTVHIVEDPEQSFVITSHLCPPRLPPRERCQVIVDFRSRRPGRQRAVLEASLADVPAATSVLTGEVIGR